MPTITVKNTDDSPLTLPVPHNELPKTVKVCLDEPGSVTFDCDPITNDYPTLDMADGKLCHEVQLMAETVALTALTEDGADVVII